MHHQSSKFNRIIIAIIPVVVLSLQTANAETPITGDISEMTLESGGNPYVVEQDILIPEGKKAVIRGGACFCSNLSPV